MQRRHFLASIPALAALPALASGEPGVPKAARLPLEERCCHLVSWVTGLYFDEQDLFAGHSCQAFYERPYLGYSLDLGLEPPPPHFYYCHTSPELPELICGTVEQLTRRFRDSLVQLLREGRFCGGFDREGAWLADSKTREQLQEEALVDGRRFAVRLMLESAPWWSYITPLDEIQLTITSYRTGKPPLLHLGKRSGDRPCSTVSLILVRRAGTLSQLVEIYRGLLQLVASNPALPSSSACWWKVKGASGSVPWQPEDV